VHWWDRDRGEEDNGIVLSLFLFVPACAGPPSMECCSQENIKKEREKERRETMKD
jgi:hypothetical protein